MIQLNSKAKEDVNIHMLKKQFEILCMLFGPLKDIHIYVCKSQADFKVCLGTTKVALPNWVVGVNRGKKIAVLEKAQLNAKGLDINSLCEHEMVHVFINHFITNCPLWLNEGLAQNLISNNNNNNIFSQKSLTHLSNPYNLSYDTDLYYISYVVTDRLLKKYGKTFLINQLKICRNFKNSNIFGYFALKELFSGTKKWY